MIAKLSRGAFYLGVVLVVVLSVLPQDHMPAQHGWDKANHALAYGALALAGGIGFRGLRPLAFVGLGLLALGASLELAQSVLPGRMASFLDLLANTVGIVLGALLAAGANAVLPPPRTDGR